MCAGTPRVCKYDLMHLIFSDFQSTQDTHIRIKYVKMLFNGLCASVYAHMCVCVFVSFSSICEYMIVYVCVCVVGVCVCVCVCVLCVCV